MKPLIIIPTMNEADFIIDVLNGIIKENLSADILIIDAQSDDGTVEQVNLLRKTHPEITILNQPEKQNYGGALKMGFQCALNNNYDPVITMDGDGAHNPKYLKDFFKLCNKYDVIIGSRYIDGVRVDGWRFRKLLISKLANMYVSYLLIKPIWDFTSGYRCYRQKFLRELNLQTLPQFAYMFQIEMLHRAYLNRVRVKEIPASYRGTKDAFSKVSPHSKFKTLWYVFKLRAPILEILRHLAYIKKEYERFVDEYEELVNPPQLKDKGHFINQKPYAVSIGVMAYNEEKIIGKCLTSLRNQKVQSGAVKEIIVVSSGSTDGTDQLVLKMAEQEKRLRLIIQPSRKGKASAINEFLSVAKGDIVIVESADTITEEDTVEKLLQPFSDEQIGMVGAHPLPVNNRRNFVGYSVHRLWELHHAMALKYPKCGEMVAFRNIISKIPRYTAVDEAAIEAIFKQSGFKLAYAAHAIVHNKGPETLKDFMKQRKRIASGHRHLKITMGHQVATAKAGNIFKYVLKTQRWNFREVFYMSILIFVEALARILGFLDFYLRDKNPFIWDMSLTTKKM